MRRIKTYEQVRIIAVMEPDEGTWYAQVFSTDGVTLFVTPSKSDGESAVQSALVRLHLWGWSDRDIRVSPI